MERTHDAALQHHIEEAFHRGWSLVPWWSLYLWYDMRRLGRNAWRDIRDRWHEIARSEEHKPKLWLHRGTGEGVLLVRVDDDRIPESKREFVSIEIQLDEPEPFDLGA